MPGAEARENMLGLNGPVIAHTARAFIATFQRIDWMPETPSRFRGSTIAILLAAPIASLLINGLSWLHYGIDLPFYDDIRPFLTRSATSLDPRVLFTPSNDTLYPVGMALDALAQRTLNGNAVAYQFISMMCLLGGLLWMQWRLLMTALEDRLLAAAAFFCTLLMLWPESYWGLQSLAYHHGLPIFFLVGALTIMLTTRWAAWWGMPAIFLLGLLAGLAYISGAFATLAAAIVLVGLSYLLWPRFPALRTGGLALLAAGAITVCAQVWVIVFFQHGHIHDPAAPWAWPTEASFWMFLLGKIGRALALPFDHPGLSLVIVLALLVLVAVLAVRLLRRLAQERAHATDGVTRIAVVFLTLTAAIAAYLPLLAAGRAYLGAPAPRTLMNMFIHGFPEHYHSFWVTVLVPWIAAAAIVTWRGAFRARSTRFYIAALGAVALVIAAVQAGAFDHSRYYRETSAMRMRTDVVCIKTILETGAHECPQTYAPQIVDALTYARQIGASFNRYFPLRPIPLGAEDPAPLFRLSRDAERVKYVNLSPPVTTTEGLAFEAAEDPILEVALPTGSLVKCWELEVSMAVKSAQNDFAELFDLKAGQAAFAAPSASSAPTREDMITTVVLRAYSLEGFKDHLRIDPVAGAQAITVKDLEVRCRQNVPRPNG